MASKDNRRWTRLDDDGDEWLEDFVKRDPDYDSESEVLREAFYEFRDRQCSPISTLRPYIVDAAVHLILVAAVVAISGSGTDIIADMYALQIGGVLVIVAGSVLAAFELAHRLTSTTPTNPFSGENA